MRPVAAAILLISAIAGSTPRAAAQDQPAGPLLAALGASSARLPIGPVSGVSFDRFGSASEGAIAFGYRRSRLTNAGPAEDIAVRLFPAGLQEGVTVIGMDVGLMQAVSLGPAALFVKGGATGLLGLASSGAALLPGIEAGVGALVRLQGRAALRVDVTRHSFYRGVEHYGLWNFSIGLSVLPAATGAGPR